MSEKENLENIDVQDFVIDETENETENKPDFVDPLDELVNHDFSKEDLNIEEYSEVINMLNTSNEKNKKFEAENIIKEIGNKYLDKEYLSNVNTIMENVKNFIRKYDNISNLSDEEKTNLFTVGKFLNQNFILEIKKMLFKITLKVEEYKFLESAFRTKILFNGEEIFNMIELNELYLKKWREIYKGLPKNTTSFDVKIDINNVVMLYHFLNKYQIKGISKEFYAFSSLLQKIAETNKIYNAFGVLNQRISDDFTRWIGNTEELNKPDIGSSDIDKDIEK